LANATAAGFFCFAMRHKHISVTSARQNFTQTSQISACVSYVRHAY
jgi:hypothetical protein